MNPEQLKTILRQVMLFAAGVIGGTTFVAKFFTTDQVVSILTSDTVIGLLTTIIGGGIASLWGISSRSDKSMVATVDALPQVAGVIMKSTPDGRDLAAAVPSTTAVVADTQAASRVAGGG